MLSLAQKTAPSTVSYKDIERQESRPVSKYEKLYGEEISTCNVVETMLKTLQ